jgi:hypothetical protein
MVPAFRGLPIEVRYQLPLALGTANETSKECTICQLRYGIGDHIVTLPCQHFFQYVLNHFATLVQSYQKSIVCLLVLVVSVSAVPAVWTSGCGTTRHAHCAARKSPLTKMQKRRAQSTTSPSALLWTRSGFVARCALLRSMQASALSFQVRAERQQRSSPLCACADRDPRFLV